MGFLSRLWRKKPSGEPNPTPKPTEAVYLTQTVVFGSGDSSVDFVDEARNIRKRLIHPDGKIARFPGVEKQSFWVKQVSPLALRPQVRYRASFETRPNGWIMLWEIQPDGDYDRDDDGFGGANRAEVTLYAYINRDGDFTAPFRIYEVGDCCYALDRFEQAHAHRYESAFQSLKDGKADPNADFLFPRIRGMNLSMGIHRLNEFYTLQDKKEADDYWNQPLLREHLLEASRTLLGMDAPVQSIAPYPLGKGVQSCMTLFLAVSGEPVFQEVLDKFFDGKPETLTAEKTDFASR